MKILKCDICGYTQCPENNNGDINIKDANRDDFYEIYHDKRKYDLCNTCINKYRQLKHDLTAAFIFYPDKKIEIKICKEQRKAVKKADILKAIKESEAHHGCKSCKHEMICSLVDDFPCHFEKKDAGAQHGR